MSDAQFTNTESERKYEDISRKMATLEADAQRGNERAEGAEKKLIELEEELKVVGAAMQALEVGEEKSFAREEQLQCEILELRQKLKVAEYRGENEEMNIQRLNVRIDQVANHHPVLQNQNHLSSGKILQIDCFRLKKICCRKNTKSSGQATT